MAEPVSNDVLRLAVATAVAASGPNPVYARVMSNIAQITLWLIDEEIGSPLHLARQVADADAHLNECTTYSGVLHSTRMDERNQRLVIKTVRNEAGETEEVSTYPAYTPQGAHMIDRINRVEAGTRILIWKAVEKHRNDPTKKARVAVHFKVLPPRDAAAGGAPNTPQRPEAGVAPTEGSSSPPSAPPASDLDPRRQAIRDNIRASKDPGATATALRERWGTVDKVPEDQLETALYMSLHEGEEPF